MSRKEKPGDSVIDAKSIEFSDNVKGMKMYLDPIPFAEAIADLPENKRKAILDKMREERMFYEKIMKEPFREKHPDSYRYGDAAFRLTKLNANGKTLHDSLTK